MDSVKLLDELKKLNFTVKNISTLTNIPQDRIYKWYNNTGKPKVEDYNKLKDLYDRIKPNPTNDFHLNVAAEPEAIYKTDKDLLIENLSKTIEELKTDKQRMADDIEYLKHKLDEAMGTSKRKERAK